MAAHTSNTYFASTSVLFPIGSVIAWLKSFTGVPAISSYWAECNGQVLNLPESPLHGTTLPNLNGVAGGAAEGDGQKYKRFLRGSATSGTAAGSQTTSATSGEPLDGSSSAQTLTRATHTHTSLPESYEVVWIVRVL